VGSVGGAAINWVVILLVLHCSGASADNRSTAREGAKEAYQRGLKQYNLGEYEAALDAFTAAYNLVPDPILLFNTAQCHRQLGHKLKALTLYKSYLRETENRTANAEEVKRLVSSLEQELAREHTTKEAPPQGVQQSQDQQPSTATNGVPPPATTQLAAQQTVKRSEPPRKRAWIFGVVGGALAVGVVAVGLGVGLGTASHERDPSPTIGKGSLQ